MEKMKEINVISTLDGSTQPSLYCASPAEGKRPLLVGLHTWSFDRYNQVENLLPIAQEYDFNLLLPEFRGSNLPNNPNCVQACGSQYAKQDIADAVEYACTYLDADRDNVFLVGLSGGGHMALLMASYLPKMFKAITAFVPISDLKMWAEENPNYRESVNACCQNSIEEMELRSPINYVDRLAKANLKIFHGKWDDVVPVSQSIILYNEVMRRYPDSSVYLDIFDGGHEIDLELAMHWIMSQYGESKVLSVTG